MYLIIALAVLLTGCIATSKYPDLCNITQPHSDNSGYIKGTFPCKLTHHEMKEKP